MRACRRKGHSSAPRGGEKMEDDEKSVAYCLVRAVAVELVPFRVLELKCRRPERGGGEGVRDENKEFVRDLDGGQADGGGGEVEGRVAGL